MNGSRVCTTIQIIEFEPTLSYLDNDTQEGIKLIINDDEWLTALRKENDLLNEYFTQLLKDKLHKTKSDDLLKFGLDVTLGSLGSLALLCVQSAFKQPTYCVVELRRALKNHTGENDKNNKWYFSKERERFMAKYKEIFAEALEKDVACCVDLIIEKMKNL